MRARRIGLLVFVVLVIAGVLGYLSWASQADRNGPLTASGTVEAVEVQVGPEISGRVREVLVQKGDRVTAGTVLFRLDDSLLQAQRRQAEAAVQAAQAQVDLAQANLELARLQYEQALQQARLAEATTRTQDWVQRPPNDFAHPLWYFTREEQLRALQAEVNAARQAWDEAQQNLTTVLQNASSADLRAAEERLARARAAFLVAQAVLDAARRGNDADLEREAQSRYDAALNELNAAQTAYDDLLSTQAAQDVLEARARVAIARERYFAALERLYALQVGDHALSVRLAEAQVRQAEQALAQAQAALAQAQAALDALDEQLARTEVVAPTDGVVLTLNIEPGEVIQPGVTALTLGRLDQLTITVYLPEDQYGTLRLGDTATVTVDAFPGETFTARVIYIAQQAEYTPRNVQTKEGRRTTVFAVELAVEDPAGKLKPGMPADVTFDR